MLPQLISKGDGLRVSCGEKHLTPLLSLGQLQLREAREEAGAELQGTILFLYWCLVINSRKSRNLFPGLQDDRSQESPRASQPAWLWARPMEVMPVQHPHVVQLFLQRQNATLQRGVLNLGD